MPSGQEHWLLAWVPLPFLSPCLCGTELGVASSATLTRLWKFRRVHADNTLAWGCEPSLCLMISSPTCCSWGHHPYRPACPGTSLTIPGPGRAGPRQPLLQVWEATCSCPQVSRTLACSEAWIQSPFALWSHSCAPSLGCNLYYPPQADSPENEDRVACREQEEGDHRRK